MHPNFELLRLLFARLNEHDHAGIVKCYDEDALFSDIAFNLRGRKQIHAMWHMICEGDIKATVLDVSADDENATAHVVDVYTFRETGRRVRNEIEGRFRIRKGRIVEHRDRCDPRDWARQAFGGLKGEIIGRVGPARRRGAWKKLHKFIAEHPEYR